MVILSNQPSAAVEELVNKQVRTSTYSMSSRSDWSFSQILSIRTPTRTIISSPINTISTITVIVVDNESIKLLS